MRLESAEKTAWLCTQCRKMCRHICTTHSTTRNEADSPTERCIVAFEALRRGGFHPEEVAQMYEKCTTCGLCMTSCGIDLDVGEVMIAARADIVDQGIAPEPAVVANQNVVSHGNPSGEPRDRRFMALTEEIATLPDQSETLYFAGCQTLYREPGIAYAIIQVLRAAQVDFTVLKETEFCCGEPQYVLGFWDAAQDTAKLAAAAISSSGASRVVFNCPSCLRIMKEKYPEWGAPLPDDIELLHVTEFLAQLISQGKLSLQENVSLRVTYHDPCDLGRRQHIYEAPRDVIKAIPGIDFVEMQLNHEYAKCCGAGGGLAATNLPLVVQASRNALGLALDVSAEVLVTACPTCRTSFARHTQASDEIKTLDIVQLVALACGVDVERMQED